MKKRKEIKLFTLIEMVVVIVIITLLASIATPIYYNYVKKANISTTKVQIGLLEQAIFDYLLDTGKLPESEDGLNALTVNTSDSEKWRGPYLKNVPRDPWGNAYQYVMPGEHGEFDVYSYGADSQTGGEGDNADIGNWANKDN